MPKNPVIYFIFIIILSISILIVIYLIFVNIDYSQNLIGGERDNHGCLGPAGYTWCEEKQICLRVWESPCNSQDEKRNIDNLIENINNSTNLDFKEEDLREFIWSDMRITGYLYTTTNLNERDIGNIDAYFNNDEFTPDNRNSGYFKNRLYCITDYNVGEILCGYSDQGNSDYFETDEEEIASLVANKNRDDITNIKIEFSDKTDTHARGIVSYEDATDGNTVFLATKVDNNWKLVFEGTESYKCAVAYSYNFPSKMVFDCAK